MNISEIVKLRLAPLMVSFGRYKFLVLFFFFFFFLIVLYIFRIVVNGLSCHKTTLNCGLKKIGSLAKSFEIRDLITQDVVLSVDTT